MIHHLSIRNYALIDQLEIDFNEGLSVITGETGSGKSIILGALDLALGARADHHAVGKLDKKCIVEVTFRLSDSLRPAFEVADVDWEKESIFRREISPSGKSRSFVNDTPLNLQAVKTLGRQLVEIHSQHENTLLKDRSFRFEFIDALAGCRQQREHFSQRLILWQEKENRLAVLRDELARLSSEKDFNEFQLNEISELGLQNLDQEEMEEELRLLTHSEALLEAAKAAQQILDGDHHPVNSSLDNLIRQFDSLSGQSRRLDEVKDRLKSALIELKDILAETEDISESIEISPARQQEIQDILDQLYRVQQKHRVSTIDELKEIEERLASEVGGTDSLEEEITALQRELDIEHKELTEAAYGIHAQRLSQKEMVESTIMKYFAQLELPNAQFILELGQTDNFNAFGNTAVRLLFSANPGMPARPLEEIASGGEMSRVMLAVKAALCKAQSFPTLILDEVDTGVSGEVALRVGEVMGEMAANMQLIAISHLPQIAGKANHHFKVYKLVDGNTTRTMITRLSTDQRVDEIAEMIGGKDFTPASRESARSLITNA